MLNQDDFEATVEHLREVCPNGAAVGHWADAVGIGEELVEAILGTLDHNAIQEMLKGLPLPDEMLEGASLPEPMVQALVQAFVLGCELGRKARRTMDAEMPNLDNVLDTNPEDDHDQA